VEPELTVATATSDRSCERCGGGLGRFGPLDDNGTLPIAPFAIAEESGCDQIPVPRLLAALNTSKIAVHTFSPRTFTRGSATLPTGALEYRASSGAPTAWISAPADSSQGLVLATDAAGAAMGLRFVPTPGFNGTVQFLASVVSGPEQSGQLATPTGVNLTFVVDVPERSVPPFLNASLSDRAFPEVDEDPLDDSAGKVVFVHTIADIVCPSLASCFYADVDDRVGGVVVAAVDVRFGSWSWRCCPQTFSASTGGCPQSLPFFPLAASGPDRALALARDHCEVRFVSVRDFNTEVDPVTLAARPASDRPFISFRAWDGTGGLPVHSPDKPWNPRMLNVSAELGRGDDSAVGTDEVPIFVRVRNVLDQPYLNITAATIVFADGDTDIPLTSTSEGILAVADPDDRGALAISVAVEAGDAVSYAPVVGITVSPSSTASECLASCTFRHTGTASSTPAFNALLRSMRYRPGGTNFSQPLANRTVVVTTSDDQLLTTLTVLFSNPNLRPTATVGPGDDTNDLQPLSRIVLLDDDQIVTEAFVSILNASGSTAFTFPPSPGFAVATTARGAAVTYHITGSTSATSAWQQFVRSFVYAGPYPQQVRVSVRDAEQESFPIVVAFTSAASYVSLSLDSEYSTLGLFSSFAFEGLPAFRWTDGAPVPHSGTRPRSLISTAGRRPGSMRTRKHPPHSRLHPSLSSKQPRTSLCLAVPISNGPKCRLSTRLIARPKIWLPTKPPFAFLESRFLRATRARSC
jgi:hypothetical protein